MTGKKNRNLQNLLTSPITLITGLIILIGLLAIGVVIIFWGRDPEPMAHVTPQVTKIQAPTLTPVILPTSTLSNQIPTEGPPIDEGDIEVGVYVQVGGTEGAGLRMRSEPGLNSTTNFTALDAEVFLVINGPVELDGYLWWHLEAPYEEARNGWSAGAFLTPIYEED